MPFPVGEEWPLVSMFGFGPAGSPPKGKTRLSMKDIEALDRMTDTAQLDIADWGRVCFFADGPPASAALHWCDSFVMRALGQISEALGGGCGPDFEKSYRGADEVLSRLRRLLGHGSMAELWPAATHLLWSYHAHNPEPDPAFGREILSPWLSHPTVLNRLLLNEFAWLDLDAEGHAKLALQAVETMTEWLSGEEASQGSAKNARVSAPVVASPAPDDEEEAHAVASATKPIALLLDCDERMAKAFAEAGYEVERGTTGFVDGTRNLPIPIYNANVVVYDPPGSSRYLYYGSDVCVPALRARPSRPECWAGHDPKPFRIALGGREEEQGEKRKGYVALSERNINNATPLMKLSDAGVAVSAGVLHICFVKRVVLTRVDASALFDWIAPDLHFHPTCDVPSKCKADPPEVWGDFFLSAPSPLVALMWYSPTVRGREQHWILRNRAYKPNALMVRDGSGAIFLLPEFEDNAAAAVRLATEIWPKLRQLEGGISSEPRARDLLSRFRGDADSMRALEDMRRPPERSTERARRLIDLYVHAAKLAIDAHAAGKTRQEYLESAVVLHTRDFEALGVYSADSFARWLAMGIGETEAPLLGVDLPWFTPFIEYFGHAALGPVMTRAHRDREALRLRKALDKLTPEERERVKESWDKAPAPSRARFSAWEQLPRGRQIVQVGFFPKYLDRISFFAVALDQWFSERLSETSFRHVTDFEKAGVILKNICLKIGETTLAPDSRGVALMKSELDVWAQQRKSQAAVVPAYSEQPHALKEPAAVTGAPAKHAPQAPHAATGEGQEPADEIRKRDEERQWTHHHCPSCGRDGIEFIPKTEFASRAGGKRGTSRRALAKKVKDGRYWHDMGGNLPWCSHCKEKTPEGRGVESPVTAPPAGSYEPSQEEAGEAMVWAAHLVKNEFGLPFPDPDLSPSDSNPNEQAAYDLMSEGATAILEAAAKRGGLLTRDEAEAIAREAMRKHYAEDYRSRVHHSQGDMLHPPTDPGNE